MTVSLSLALLIARLMVRQGSIEDPHAELSTPLFATINSAAHVGITIMLGRNIATILIFIDIYFPAVYGIGNLIG